MPRITAFAVASPLTGTEVVPCVQGGSDVQTTSADIAALAAAATVNTNAQSGASYTVVSGDRSKLVKLSNASGCTVALPTASSVGAGWFCYLQNTADGTVTVTPTTSTIDGAASIYLGPREGVLVASDGTNYSTLKGAGRRIVLAQAYLASTTVDLTPYPFCTEVIVDITLAGNVTFNITNGKDGQKIIVRCRQDATGNRTWTSGANLRFSADTPSITLSTGANKLDYLAFRWNGTDSKADFQASNLGF